MNLSIIMIRGMVLFVFLFVLHVVVQGRVSATTTSPYVHYQPGTLNVILSVPHGGTASPSHIPDRTSGCWDGSQCIFTHTCGPKNTSRCSVETYTNRFTLQLADKVSAVLQRLTGKSPHVVKCHLRRLKMDANREKGEGTFGVREAEEAWEAYHGYIQTARNTIPGQGLFIDIYGHEHPTQWTELGYLISKPDLISGNLSGEVSSVRNIYSVSGMGMEELIIGTTSIGNYLNYFGYDAVPSPESPSPGNASYFAGGYMTKRYGSRDGGKIDAIQIETPHFVRFNSTERTEYGLTLAVAIKFFLDQHYATVNKD